MEKGKELLRTIGRWSLVLVLVGVVGFLGWKNIGLLKRYLASERQQANLQQRIDELQKDKQDLKLQLQEVESKENLEQVAREQLSFKKEGENVFVVLPPKEKTNSEKATNTPSSWSKVNSFFHKTKDFFVQWFSF